MQLFARNVLLSGPLPEVMSYATDARSYVSDKLDTEVALWSAMFGAPAGSMTFAARVDGLAGAAANTATLMADDEYHSLVARGREYLVGAPEDSLSQPLHGELGESPPPVGSVATITTAVAATSFSNAVGWGVEMAQLVESITGMPVLFMANQAGRLGEFGWIGIAADVAAADAAGEKLTGNADYINKVDGAVDLFVSGASTRVIATRVA